MRLFAGLPLHLDAVERLTALRLRLASPQDGLRWSPPEQWHLTLRFFGEADGDSERDLKEQLSNIQEPSPAMRLEGLGTFPSKGILYAEVAQSPALGELHAKVQAIAVACALAPDSHPFRPHITLARSRNRHGLETLKRLSTPALPSLGVPILWSAPEMLLYGTVVQPGGAVYTTLARFALR